MGQADEYLGLPGLILGHDECVAFIRRREGLSSEDFDLRPCTCAGGAPPPDDPTAPAHFQHVVIITRPIAARSAAGEYRSPHPYIRKLSSAEPFRIRASNGDWGEPKTQFSAAEIRAVLGSPDADKLYGKLAKYRAEVGCVADVVNSHLLWDSDLHLDSADVRIEADNVLIRAQGQCCFRFCY